MKYEVVIGLEIHAQLLTKTKIFCSCPIEFGAKPNSQVCPVCSGMPGSLPVLNKTAVDYAIRMGLATDCSIRHESIFERKNYFYPDLPKGYQISQFEIPICENGFIKIKTKDGNEKKIRLNRIHMEEDAGKLSHDKVEKKSNVDFNRCGTPLIEIVSEPDISSAEEAVLYMEKVRQIVQYMGVGDGNMDQGSLRCDVNISLRPEGQTKLGTKAELKNMNSFKFAAKAIEFEIERQTEILDDGGKILQQTLLWDEVKEETRPMRTKEESNDYRYFPDPDLMPLIVTDKQIESIRSTMPELPETRYNRYLNELKLSEFDANVLTSSKDVADYFELALKKHNNPKIIGNWIMSELMRAMNDKNCSINDIGIDAKDLAELVELIDNKTISGKIAKQVFPDMLESGKSPSIIVEEKGLVQVTDTAEIEAFVQKVIDESPAQVEQFKAGKTKVIGFFVGQVMKLSKGKANPAMVNEILNKLLK